MIKRGASIWRKRQEGGGMTAIGIDGVLCGGVGGGSK